MSTHTAWYQHIPIFETRLMDHEANELLIVAQGQFKCPLRNISFRLSDSGSPCGLTQAGNQVPNSHLLTPLTVS